MSENGVLSVNWQKVGGLLPVVVQDFFSGAVLMVAYMNKEALEISLSSGFAHYFSRTKNRIWKKGEESGNFQKIKKMRLDCDNDALLIMVAQTGVACHTGAVSCFFNEIVGNFGAENLELNFTTENRSEKFNEKFNGEIAENLGENFNDKIAKSVATTENFGGEKNIVAQNFDSEKNVRIQNFKGQKSALDHSLATTQNIWGQNSSLPLNSQNLARTKNFESEKNITFENVKEKNFAQNLAVENSQISQSLSQNLPPKYDILDILYHTALNRKFAQNAENSYIATLYKKGENSYLKKIAEESGEFILALKDLAKARKYGDLSRESFGEHRENEPEFDAIYEAADILFHMIVALADFDIHPERVLSELKRREGRSGIEEKNAR